MNELLRQAQAHLPSVLPLLVLALGAGLLPLLAALGAAGRRLAPLGALVVLASAAVISGRGFDAAAATPLATYNGFVRYDAYGVFATVLLVTGSALVTLISWRYAGTVGSDHPEHYALILFSCSGMVVMAHATDLLALFLGLEILSLALYALTAMPKTTESVEAAMKYFLLGAFASGFYLMGAALLFGASGTTHLAGLASGASSPLAGIGAALLLSAMAFKLALPPFHMWAPDAYQGAPSSVTAFMAFGTKAAVFFALGRAAFGGAADPEAWRGTAVAVALAAMIWGNTVAIAQSHLRRLVAYSSISHAGTILLGVAAGTAGATPMLFYLVAYTLAVVGLFAVVTALRRQGQEVVLIRDLAGLSRRSPLLSALLALFLLSLAGFPPTAGFLAKLLVFRAAVGSDLVAAAAVGALASAVGVFYYLYVVVTMYMRSPQEGEAATTVDLHPEMALALLVTFVGTLPLGLFPERILQLAESAVRSLRG